MTNTLKTIQLDACELRLLIEVMESVESSARVARSSRFKGSLDRVDPIVLELERASSAAVVHAQALDDESEQRGLIEALADGAGEAVKLLSEVSDAYEGWDGPEEIVEGNGSVFRESLYKLRRAYHTCDVAHEDLASLRDAPPSSGCPSSGCLSARGPSGGCDEAAHGA